MQHPTDFRGVFRDDDDARAVYAEAAGIARALPLAVAVPVDADDVAALARWASATGTPLVPRGSGSSMAGGAVGDGVIVDLSRLDVIGEVDVERRRVRVGPGALHARVDAAARRHRLRFPPDPSSGKFCTIGGMASTNAAGAHTMRYGATREWVVALDCVFADGARVELRRGEPSPAAGVAPALDRFAADVRSDLLAHELASPSVHAGVRKESSGYGLAAYARTGDLVDLVVGSEGTLAIVVGAELALAPTPGATSSVLASFASLEEAVAAAAAARAADASACELLDRTFLELVASSVAKGHEISSPEVPAGSEAVLLAEVEGQTLDDAVAQASALGEIFRRGGATRVTLALDDVQEPALWELRHAASPVLARLDPSLKSMQFVEDGAVPAERLPDYVRGVREALARRGLRGVIFGHAGDGHVHVNPLVDVTRDGWRDDVRRLLDDVVSLTARLGGTLAGEHGDGRLRAPLLERVWPAATRALFARVKAAFDPDGVLNPGVIVPLAGQRAVGDVKYDPELPPLPDPARRVLRRVEGERAYAQFRLAMLDEQL
ncbi:MAG TPA: FAD-binding oxidoreductase [Gemmatimonadaceae bacterium]|nr:FAD-binding oxidoreductase [Gemmatimonadaceae bacterium]